MQTKLAIAAALIGTLILGAVLSGYGVAQQSAPALSTSFSDSQEDEIRELVRAYLLENPEIIIESLNEYQDRERRAEEQKLQDGARENMSALLEGDGANAIGADTSKAKVAVVEFFDYHCGYCKRANGLVQELTKNDPDVKVVFRELPILREESEIAASYALAAREQGKYAELHFALMSEKGVLSEDRIKAIAKEAGLNVKALEKAAKNPKIDDALDETQRIAQEMGADGTPTFVIASLNGDFVEVIPGYSAEKVLGAIEAAKRAAK